MRRLVIGSLDRWVTEFGVDGFRFDLAPALLRGPDGPDLGAAILGDLDALLVRHPGLKVIAEPWDVGPGGYLLGAFPDPWREWNDRFREDARALWSGGGSWPALADALMGSNAVFGAAGRPVTASVNAVVTHDGLTLADLVATQEPDPAVRPRLVRSLLGTVAFAQGVPMVLAGDELGRSQGGEHDGYTLPSEQWGLAWDEGDQDLVAWVAAAFALRRALPALHRAARVEAGDDRVRWLDLDGGPRDDISWAVRDHPYLGVHLAGDPDHAGALLLVVADAVPVAAHLPPGDWEVALDAGDARPPDQRSRHSGIIDLEGPTLVLLLPVETQDG
jgi:glycogen operon protein